MKPFLALCAALGALFLCVYHLTRRAVSSLLDASPNSWGQS